MNDQERFEAAAQLLAAKGIGANKFMLPIFRVLSKLFFGGRPPYFRNFGANILSYAIIVIPISGLLRWFLVWSPEKLPLKGFVVITLVTGVTIALLGAASAEYLKRKYCLPKWEEIRNDQPGRTSCRTQIS